MSILEIECPCCGDVGAVADNDGRFRDGQELVCGCPGQVSCDVETEPDITINDLECVACRLRDQLKTTVEALQIIVDITFLELSENEQKASYIARNALDAIQKLDEPALKLKSRCPSCGSDPDVDCICKGQNG